MANIFSQKYLVETEFRNNLNVDVVKIFFKVQEVIETRDKSLMTNLRDVILNFNN